MTIDHPLKQRLASFIRQVWNEGDANAADAYLAETYVIHHDPGDPWDGMRLDRAGFQERVRASRAPFPDQRFDIQRLLADGRDVAMSWLWTGTHLGALAGFPPSGRSIRMSGVTVYMFDEDQRLTGHWQVTDRLSVYQQLQQSS